MHLRHLVLLTAAASTVYTTSLKDKDELIESKCNRTCMVIAVGSAFVLFVFVLIIYLCYAMNQKDKKKFTIQQNASFGKSRYFDKSTDFKNGSIEENLSISNLGYGLYTMFSENNMSSQNISYDIPFDQSEKFTDDITICDQDIGSGDYSYAKQLVLSRSLFGFSSFKQKESNIENQAEIPIPQLDIFSEQT
ncbi:uncharacterized protein LOC124817445 isoform X2 [Hydra vulgaris]|uniref:Uncharacterized protein LOC124817445 isoform X2 n=1 Tax=Hydra vulgaris TaxID=6087 RepID=A0ABM4CFJ5_HYDVU